jgi:hypothetical protein
VLLIESLLYDSNAIISLYIKNIKHQCPEKNIDHLWTQILRFYFHLNDNYSVEREARTGEGSMARTNVLLTNIQHRHIEKAVFIECKRLTTKAKTATNNKWKKTADQLKNYIVGSRKKGHATDLYGIVAITHKTRFYKLPAGKGELESWSGGLFEKDHTFSTKSTPRDIH